MKFIIKLFIVMLIIPRSHGHVVFLYENEKEHAVLARKSFSQITLIPEELIYVKYSKCRNITKSTLTFCLNNHGHLSLRYFDEKKFNARYRVLKDLKENI